MLHHIGSDNPCRHSLSKRSAPRELQGGAWSVAGCRASFLIMSHLRSPRQLPLLPIQTNKFGETPRPAARKRSPRALYSRMGLILFIRHKLHSRWSLGRQASPRRMKQDVQQIWFATRQRRYFRFNEGLRWAAGSSPRSVNNKCKKTASSCSPSSQPSCGRDRWPCSASVPRPGVSRPRPNASSRPWRSGRPSHSP
jgi:hypothetical protein